MKCPNCKENNLVMAKRKGIEIDCYPDCRGIWLDRGELDKILEKSKETLSRCGYTFWGYTVKWKLWLK